MGFKIIAFCLIIVLGACAEMWKRFRPICYLLIGIVVICMYNPTSLTKLIGQGLLTAKDIQTCKVMHDFSVGVAEDRDKGVPESQVVEITKKLLARMGSRSAITPAQKDQVRAAVLDLVGSIYHGDQSSLTPKQIGDSITDNCGRIKIMNLIHGTPLGNTLVGGDP
ncbi:MAG: hypothetical protein WA005_16940 [Candidatus Binataceae bacterium]